MVISSSSLIDYYVLSVMSLVRERTLLKILAKFDEIEEEENLVLGNWWGCLMMRKSRYFLLVLQFDTQIIIKFFFCLRRDLLTTKRNLTKVM